MVMCHLLEVIHAFFSQIKCVKLFFFVFFVVFNSNGELLRRPPGTVESPLFRAWINRVVVSRASRWDLSSFCDSIDQRLFS